MTLHWHCKHHNELSKEELYALLLLRTRVFVVEQNCPYLEVDGQDLLGHTCHLLAWRDGELLAYLRLLDPQLQAGEVVIGRVVIAPEARGCGLGHQLMEHALNACAERWPEQSIYLSAQAHLCSYYGRYGLLPVTEVYLEDGIPHIGMQRASP